MKRKMETAIVLWAMAVVQPAGFASDVRPKGDMLVAGQVSTVGAPRGASDMLSIDLIDPQTCYKAGDTICFEVNMTNLSQSVTGFQAFLEYDPALLTFEVAQSCYSAYTMPNPEPVPPGCPQGGPFPVHLTLIANSETAPGEIDLNGTSPLVGPGSSGTSANSLLATLCFTINSGNDGVTTLLAFRASEFSSVISSGGSPLSTTLVDSASIGIDQTPPTLTCPNPVTVNCASEVPAAAADLAEFLALTGAMADDTPALCGGLVITHVNDAEVGDCQSGTISITRTYRATDVAGNETECEQSITILQDNVPPDIDEVPPTLFIECEDAIPAPFADLDEAIDAGLEVSDTCGLTLSLFHTLDAGSCDRLIGRIYRVTDECGNFSTFKHVISIDDTTGPDYSGTNASFSVDAACSTVAVLTITVHDNCGLTPAQVADPVVVPSGPADFGMITWDKQIVDEDTVDVVISVPVSNLTACPAIVEANVTATDNCLNETTSGVYTATITDSTIPAITCPADVTIECHESSLPADTGEATAIDNCDPAPVINFSDAVAAGSCPNSYAMTRTWTAVDACGNEATCDQLITVQDTTEPLLICPAPVTVHADAGLCTARAFTGTRVETFDNTPPLSAGAAAGRWYTDRYAPAAFETASFDGDLRLRQFISAADSICNRPVGFKTQFYNYQGRKYDINFAGEPEISVDVYIPSEWATDARSASLWATAYNSANAVSAYPILSFVANDPADAVNPNPNPANVVPRFRAWDQTGVWIDLGLPPGFAYDQWVTLRIKMTASAFEYTVETAQGNLVYSDPDPLTSGSIYLGNLMLQGYNFGDLPLCPAGDSYDIHWDNLTLPAAATDNCAGEIVITSSRSDNPLLTTADPFPVGTTTVTYTSTDICGNSITCEQEVTVLGSNLVTATVELRGVVLDSPVTRCIRFIPRSGGVCGSPVDVSVTFSGGVSGGPYAQGVVSGDDLAIPCAIWDSMCVKDEQHTLSESQALIDSGAMYAAGGIFELGGGDTDNDNDVDINDVTLFLFQYDAMIDANSAACPWDASASADFSLNGHVGGEDYSFLSENWQAFANCCVDDVPWIAEPVPDGKPIKSKHEAVSGIGDGRRLVAEAARLSIDTATISVTRLPVEIGRKADRNLDGVIDVTDVEMFEAMFGLDGTLSQKMRITSSIRAGQSMSETSLRN